MWESQVLLTDGQVVFLRVLWFSPTFDERSARYKWNILERAVKPKLKKKKKKTILGVCKVSFGLLCIFRPSWACAKYHLGFCLPFIHSVSGQGTCSDHGCTSWSGPLLSTYSQRHVFTWCELFNLYHSLGIFSRWQIDIFLIFPRKQDLTFHANCLLEKFAWNVKFCFLGKIRKISQNVVCWNFFPEC